jgi:putative flippase GtrA
MVNRLILDFAELFFLAFLIATGASTILNFAGQKWWVFK